MLRRVTVTFAAAVALIAALGVAHGQQSALHASIASVSEGAYPSATLLATVEDTSGGDLKSLSPANFTVTIDHP